MVYIGIGYIQPGNLQSTVSGSFTPSCPTTPVEPNVSVKLFVSREVSFGEAIRVVGDTSELGQWQPASGPALCWTPGHTWTAQFDLPPGSYHFKCVKLSSGNTIEWEAGPDRFLQIPEDAYEVEVTCDWSQTDSTCVNVRDSPSRQQSISAYCIPLEEPFSTGAAAQQTNLEHTPYPASASTYNAVATAVGVQAIDKTSADDDKAFVTRNSVLASITSTDILQLSGIQQRDTYLSCQLFELEGRASSATGNEQQQTPASPLTYAGVSVSQQLDTPSTRLSNDIWPACVATEQLVLPENTQLTQPTDNVSPHHKSDSLIQTHNSLSIERSADRDSTPAGASSVPAAPSFSVADVQLQFVDLQAASEAQLAKAEGGTGQTVLVDPFQLSDQTLETEAGLELLVAEQEFADAVLEAALLQEPCLPDEFLDAFSAEEQPAVSSSTLSILAATVLAVPDSDATAVAGTEASITLPGAQKLDLTDTPPPPAAAANSAVPAGQLLSKASKATPRLRQPTDTQPPPTSASPSNLNLPDTPPVDVLYTTLADRQALSSASAPSVLPHTNSRDTEQQVVENIPEATVLPPSQTAPTAGVPLLQPGSSKNSKPAALAVPDLPFITSVTESATSSISQRTALPEQDLHAGASNKNSCTDTVAEGPDRQVLVPEVQVAATEAEPEAIAAADPSLAASDRARALFGNTSEDREKFGLLLSSDTEDIIPVTSFVGPLKDTSLGGALSKEGSTQASVAGDPVIPEEAPAASADNTELFPSSPVTGTRSSQLLQGRDTFGSSSHTTLDTQLGAVEAEIESVWFASSDSDDPLPVSLLLTRRKSPATLPTPTPLTQPNVEASLPVPSPDNVSSDSSELTSQTQTQGEQGSGDLVKQSVIDPQTVLSPRLEHEDPPSPPDQPAVDLSQPAVLPSSTSAATIGPFAQPLPSNFIDTQSADTTEPDMLTALVRAPSLNGRGSGSTTPLATSPISYASTSTTTLPAGNSVPGTSADDALSVSLLSNTDHRASPPGGASLTSFHSAASVEASEQKVADMDQMLDNWDARWLGRAAQPRQPGGLSRALAAAGSATEPSQPPVPATSVSPLKRALSDTVMDSRYQNSGTEQAAARVPEPRDVRSHGGTPATTSFLSDALMEDTAPLAVPLVAASTPTVQRASSAPVRGPSLFDLAERASASDTLLTPAADWDAETDDSEVTVRNGNVAKMSTGRASSSPDLRALLAATETSPSRATSASLQSTPSTTSMDEESGPRLQASPVYASLLSSQLAAKTLEPAGSSDTVSPDTVLTAVLETVTEQECSPTRDGVSQSMPVSVPVPISSPRPVPRSGPVLPPTPISGLLSSSPPEFTKDALSNRVRSPPFTAHPAVSGIVGRVRSSLADIAEDAASASAAVATNAFAVTASTVITVASSAASAAATVAPVLGKQLSTAVTALRSADLALPQVLERETDEQAGGMDELSVGTDSLRLVAGAHMIPHIDKVEKGGEDAYFISPVGQGGIGVADGVSGWADEGIDPAEYPRTLVNFARDAWESSEGSVDAVDMIRYAQMHTVLKGSSTLCLALMRPSNRMQVANLGDSGVRIIRNGTVVYASEAQQHAFNMPYQLSHPTNVDNPDTADDADVALLDVRTGDIIILATDGLYDNVFDEEIEEIVAWKLAGIQAQQRLIAEALGSPSDDAAAQLKPRYTVQNAADIARVIAERAHMHARNPTRRTPWSVTSSQQPGFMWAKFFAKGGGKMDDCTVVVAFVTE